MGAIIESLRMTVTRYVLPASAGLSSTQEMASSPYPWSSGLVVIFTSVLSSVLVSQVLLAYWLKVAKPKKLPIAE